MPSTYSNLKIQLMATGENTTTWGDITNVNIGAALGSAIASSKTITYANASQTLTWTDTNAPQDARFLRLNLTGAATAGYNLVVPAIGDGKPYIVNNGTDGTITVKNATGTGIAVPAGKTMWVYNNGTNVVDAVTHLTSLTLGTFLPIASGGTGGNTAATARTALGATSVGSNVFTLTNPSAITFPRFNADNSVSALAAAAFRTAIGSTTLGDNLYTITNPSAVTFPRFNVDNTVSALDAATFRTAIGAGTSSTTGTVTSVGMTVPTFLSVTPASITTSGTFAVTLSGTALPIANGGTGSTSTTYCSLTANVTGTLPVGNGGTGAATLTGILKGNGTLAFTAATAGTDYVAPGGALGTPSSGTLTNCTFPTLNQSTTGSAATLTTARTLTIGATGKTFNGSANVAWSLAEIGAAASGANTDITSLGGLTTALSIGQGGTGQNTAPLARTALGATTVGGNFFTLTNPSAITFPRINADNTVSALDAASFRTAIGAGSGGGSVTSVSFTGGIVSVATATTTPALTVAGTSGGIPYFSSASTWATSAALAANAIVIGGGAGVAPSTTTTGTGVLTALGIAVGSAGAVVTFNGALGTPSSGMLTNATGLPISTGVSGLGTSVATALGVAVGSAGAVVTFNGALGTPSSGTLTNATGLPISTGVSGLGTSVATALGVAVGSAGAVVTFNGALGTPSSGTLTNCTFPTLNQNTTGSAATLTTARTLTIGSTGKTFDGSANVSWTLGEIGAAASGANTDITALDQDITITATGTIAANTIGYRGIPQNAQTASYTLALSDAGKHISITTGGVVVPANSSIAFPIGSTISVYNNSASSQSISITTDTMYLAGTATTGSRTLAQRGVATILKVDTTTWVISGGGLT